MMARGRLSLTSKTRAVHWRLLHGWVVVKHDSWWLTRFPRDTVDWWTIWIRWGEPSYPRTSRRWRLKILDVKFAIYLWNRKRREPSSWDCIDTRMVDQETFDAIGVQIEKHRRADGMVFSCDFDDDVKEMMK